MYVQDVRVRRRPTEAANVCQETGQEHRTSGGSRMADLRVWHARLGHITTKVIQDMGDCVNVLKIKKNQVGDDDDKICEGCMMGKSTVKKFIK